jgi:hypothetical protein
VDIGGQYFAFYFVWRRPAISAGIADSTLASTRNPESLRTNTFPQRLHDPGLDRNLAECFQW